MTYIVGWKSKNSVFLAADSAITRIGVPLLDRSSFGERHLINKGELVEEAMLKLCVIKNKAIIAIAGDNRKALEVVKTFNDACDCYDTKEAFERAIISCGPYSEDTKIGIILGYIKDGIPHLVSFTDKDNIIEHAVFTHVGSLASYYPALTENLVNLFVIRKLADEHMLVAVSGVLQSYGIFDQLMRMHVGGAFFGISIDASGIHWQNDTSYVIYNFEPQVLNFITAIERENSLFVNSTFTQDIRAFSNTINAPYVQDNIDRFKIEVKELFDSGKSVFYVFVSNKDRLITVLKTDNKLDTNYLRIIADKKGHFDLFFSPELMELLNKPVISKDDSSLPFRFNWRNCV